MDPHEIFQYDQNEARMREHERQMGKWVWAATILVLTLVFSLSVFVVALAPRQH